MTNTLPILFVMLFGIISASLVIGIWYWRFRKTSKRISENYHANTNLVSVYRARYGSDALMGELYISKDEIRFEKAGINTFSSTPQGIEKIVYNNRSILIIMKNGQNFVLRYLHPSVEKEGVLNYWSFYSVLYNDPETLQSLIEELRALNITVSKGATGQESPYYYLAVGCALFSFVIIFTLFIAKFILGMSTFLGIKL